MNRGADEIQSNENAKAPSHRGEKKIARMKSEGNFFVCFVMRVVIFLSLSKHFIKSFLALF